MKEDKPTPSNLLEEGFTPTKKDLKDFRESVLKDKLLEEAKKEAEKLINDGLMVDFDANGYAKLNNPHFNIIYASAFEQGAQFIINKLNELKSE